MESVQEYRVLKSEILHKQVLESFLRFHDECSFTDVTLVCENGDSFNAHRTILSASSPYFHAMLEDNPCEHSVIILPDVKRYEMSVLLQYMYNGETLVEESYVDQVMETAIALKVHGLEKRRKSSSQENDCGIVDLTQTVIDLTDNAVDSTDSLSATETEKTEELNATSNETDNAESPLSRADTNSSAGKGMQPLLHVKRAFRDLVPLDLSNLLKKQRKCRDDDDDDDESELENGVGYEKPAWHEPSESTRKANEERTDVLSLSHLDVSVINQILRTEQLVEQNSHQDYQPVTPFSNVANWQHPFSGLVKTSRMPANVDQNTQVTIWQGLLQWTEMHSETSRQVRCSVTSALINGQPILRTENWPENLVLRLFPKRYIGNLAQHLKNAVCVQFNPTPSVALDSLTEIMGNNYSGCVTFRNCEQTKILLLFYVSDKDAYLGMVPNQQAEFAQQLSKVIQHRKRRTSAFQRQDSWPTPVESNPEPQSFVESSALEQRYPSYNRSSTMRRLNGYAESLNAIQEEGRRMSSVPETFSDSILRSAILQESTRRRSVESAASQPVHRHLPEARHTFQDATAATTYHPHVVSSTAATYLTGKTLEYPKVHYEEEELARRSFSLMCSPPQPSFPASPYDSGFADFQWRRQQQQWHQRRSSSTDSSSGGERFPLLGEIFP